MLMRLRLQTHSRAGFPNALENRFVVDTVRVIRVGVVIVIVSNKLKDRDVGLALDELIDDVLENRFVVDAAIVRE